MLVWLIQVAIVSFSLIYLIHHLFTFFKTTLTVPKVKDLVSGQNEKYKHIMDTLANTNASENSYTNIDDLIPNSGFTQTQIIGGMDHNFSNNENSTMKNELKSFLKKQMRGT